MSPPSSDATILNYLNDGERGAPLSFIGYLALPPPPNDPPPNDPPPTPQYLTSLMTERERGDAIIFCRILAPPPPPQTPQYLTTLMTEREGEPLLFCRILAPPMPPPPHDLKILYYFNDRDEGRYNILEDFGVPPMPLP